MAQQNERPATLSKLVGKQVKLHLFLKEMSGRDLAGKLGVSPSWVSYRLSGKQEIGIDDLFAIANVLGVDLNDLLTPDVVAKAKDTGFGQGVSRDFEFAPAEQAVTVGQASVGVTTRVSRTPRRRPAPRPFSQPKPGPTRPVSAVPARKRRPGPVRPGVRRTAQ